LDFRKTSLEKIWGMLNNLQLIYHLSAFSIVTPANYEMFLAMLRTSLKFGFEIFPFNRWLESAKLYVANNVNTANVIIS